MTPIYIILEPFNPATGLRETVRLASAASSAAMGLEGQAWAPAVAQRPVFSIELMSPDLDGRVQAGQCNFAVNLNAFAGGAAMAAWKWLGAPIALYSAPDLALPSAPDFAGRVSTPTLDRENLLLSVQASVDTTFLDKPLLTEEFDGSGDIGGEAEARGTLKPAGFGACENIPPVWFDKTNWIGMIDGYGNTAAITRLMEGLNDFGARVADYASYAALKAAIVAKTIAPGRWGTCVAEGLVGLGAPPIGPITVNATFGSNRLGAIAQRILAVHAGVPGGNVDAPAFAALDAAVDRGAHYWTSEQREVRGLLEAMAASANATPLVTGQNTVTITRAVASAPLATLDRSGSTLPRVTDWKTTAARAPVWRLAARTARPASVIDLKDVNYVDDIIDRGAWAPGTVYRAGNVAWLPDKSSWLYIGEAPTSGNAPPLWPIAANAYWQNLTPPLDPLAIGIETGATRNVPGALLQDGVFLDEYWSLDGLARAFAYSQAPSGFALEIPYLGNVDSFTAYGGAGDFYIEVQAGKRLWVRFECSPEGQALFELADGQELLIDGAETLIAAEYAQADWNLEASIDWFQADGTPISRAALAAVDPVGGQEVIVATTVPPAGARKARLLLGHSAQAGKKGSWAVWSPWVADHQPAADITAENAPAMQIPPAQVVAAKSDGTVKTGELPRTLSSTRARGGLDVTQQAAWSAVFAGATGSIDDDPGGGTRGQVTIDGLPGNSATIAITSQLDDVELTQVLAVTKDLAPADSGGNGTTTIVRDVDTSVLVSSYDEAGSIVASGTIALAAGQTLKGIAPLGYQATGASVRLAGKWRYSVAGAGVWTDFAAETVGITALGGIEPEPGAIAINPSVGGLAAGDYDVELLLRRYSGDGANATGTATIKGE